MASLTVQVASDLHIECLRTLFPPERSFAPVPDRDLLILAGDIAVEDMALPFVERELRRSPVIYVPGNHEYHTRQLREVVDADWREAARRLPGLHYLAGEAVEIDGVRIWGGPWHSDLWGADPRQPEGERLHRLISQSVFDFDPRHSWGAQWTVGRHVNAHHEQTEALRSHAGELDIVVTHWPPTVGALHPKYKLNEMNPYFLNQAPALVAEIGASLWVSGHTHEPYEFREGGTLCVGNPSGYPKERRQSRLFSSQRSFMVETGLGVKRAIPKVPGERAVPGRLL